MNRCESKAHAFAVGLELERTERASQREEEEKNGHVIPQVMHRYVAPTLFDCVVRYSLSAETLAEALCMAESSLDATVGAKLSRRSARMPNGVHAAKRYEAFLGECNKHASNASKRASAEVARFAKQLQRRLEQVAKERHGERVADVSMKRSRGELCGFSRSAQRGVSVVAGGLASVRTDKGIYGRCLSVGAVGRQGAYFEVVVEDDCGAGGVCVGVAPLGGAMGLVGSEHNSVGLHSSGKLVRDGEFVPFGARFGSGDVVGVLVRPRDAHGDLALHFWVNTHAVGETRCARYPHNTLRAAVSMLRDGSRAMLLCCAAQWRAPPPGVHPTLCGAR